MSEEKLNIGLLHHLCPVCAETEMDAEIILNCNDQGAINKRDSAMVKELDGKSIWSDKVCDGCQEMLDKAFVLIGAIKSKTTDDNNPYRSGNIWGITKEKAKEIIGDNLPKCGFAVIDVHDALKIGLPNVNMEDV